MNVRRWIGPSVLLIGLICVSFGLHGQEIEWKAFKQEGKPFYQKIETDTVQDLTVAEMKFKQKQKQTFMMKWTPKGEKDGKLIIEQEIIGVKMDLDIGGNKISYDPTDETPAKNPMTQFFKALQTKGKFTLHVDKKTHKVEKVEGLKELINELSTVNKSFEPVLKQILSEKTVETLAEPVFGMIPPDGTIPKEKKWEGEKTTLSMGPLGTYITKNSYTLEPDDNKNLLKIKVETDLTYEKPKDTTGGLPFKIKDGKLKTDKSEGTILFDKDKGRIQSSKLHVELSGTLTVEISGTETKVDLTQTQDVTVETYDENPWEKKKTK